jgi:ubiquinone/menaquinone biosynthesis C-methylase UbiE
LVSINTDAAATKSETDARARIHGMRSSVAGAWVEHAEFVDARGAELTRHMLDVTAPQPGERVIELACGAGGVGLAASPLVGSAGEVVLSDVAPPMVKAAGERARHRGLDNITTQVLDLEDIAVPEESFDVVVCRDGLQFAIEPSRAAAEIRRILRRGGRVAVATWGPRAANPWLGVVLDAVSAQVGRPLPPPGMPGPFALDEPSKLTAILTGAGLREVSVAERPAPMRTGSVDEWWRRTPALAGPLAHVLAGMPQQARDELGRHRTQRSGVRGQAAGNGGHSVARRGVICQALIRSRYSARCSAVGGAPVRRARSSTLRGVWAESTNSTTSTR